MGHLGQGNSHINLLMHGIYLDVKCPTPYLNLCFFQLYSTPGLFALKISILSPFLPWYEIHLFGCEMSIQKDWCILMYLCTLCTCVKGSITEMLILGKPERCWRWPISDPYSRKLREGFENDNKPDNFAISSKMLISFGRYCNFNFPPPLNFRYFWLSRPSL